ncbi:hypothetical protein CISIN_1g041218mg [Citrus sinensis]|uniref:WAT1-related protein n=1 Tax=Citrus sinensis TaxID=2711 RepID=A0A067FFW6_CITSI|nr:hypothetical protein CISIN_1g041218mg [Citrus sinensis]
MAMLGLQCSYAGVAVFTGAALLQGMSPRGSVVYRQAMATLIIAPIAYFSRRKSRIPPLGFKSFSLIFLTALIVITINQNMFYEGLYLASSTMGTAMGNLIPAITFVLAAIVGSCCWSLWPILQVLKKSSNSLLKTNCVSVSLTVCMGFFATIQSAIVTLFLEPDPESWALHTNP